jgi:hypothetical protein
MGAATLILTAAKLTPTAGTESMVEAALPPWSIMDPRTECPRACSNAWVS